GTEQFDEHDHIDRIHGSVKTPAENCADVIPGAPGQRHANPYFTPVRGDRGDPAPCAPVSRKDVEAPAQQTRAPGLGDERQTVLATCPRTKDSSLCRVWPVSTLLKPAFSKR